MRQLPNILSCLRVALSISLLLLINYPYFFVAGYIICGITDIADGYVARKYKAESKLGSSLDSVGDMVFWAIILYLLFFHIKVKIDSIALLGVIVVAIARIINIIITKVKFHEWGVMHSVGNKSSGLLIFIALPICFVVGHIPLLIAIPVLIVALISSIEEFLILLTSTSYDSNRSSIFKQ